MQLQMIFLLTELLRKPLVSIEILPGGLKNWSPPATEDFPFVFDQQHLGIPQKVLYNLYIAALALYKGADQTQVLALSSIVLLANPAHQTLLNARKSLLTSSLLRADEEMHLTSLLIGGSKECAKHSIIWDHRRWILCHRYERIGDVRFGKDVEIPGWATSEEASLFPMLPLDVLEKECELIRSACELYPRNYHAWSHYHWILNVAAAVVLKSLEQADAGSDDYIRFLRQEMMYLRGWIDRHVSDYSAVQLLCNVAVLDRAFAFQLAQNGRETLMDEIREHALDLVLTYPSHETLWLYLRNTLLLSFPEISRKVLDNLRSREDIPSATLERYCHGLECRFAANAK